MTVLGKLRFWQGASSGESDPAMTGTLRLLTVGYICTASVTIITRTATDTLFLEQYGRKALAAMYVVNACIVALAALQVGRWANRSAVSRVLIRYLSAASAIAVALAITLRGKNPLLTVAAYAWTDAALQGSMLLYGAFVPQILNLRELKKNLPFFGAMGTISCIAAGMMVRPIARWFGTSSLLLVTAGLLALLAYVVAALSRRHTVAQRAAIARTSKRPTDLRGALKVDAVRYLAAHVALATVCNVLVDYQFKAAAQSAYRGPALAAFFGTFLAATNVLILVLQTFVVGRLLRGRGLKFALMVLPTSLLGGSAAVLTTAATSAIVGTRFAGQVSQYTAESTALQMLYVGIPRRLQTSVRSLVEGLTKPLSIALVGTLIYLTAGHIPIHYFGVPVTILAAVWIWVSRKNYALYLSGLADGLRKQSFTASDEWMQEKSALEFVGEALGKARPEDASYLAALMRQFEGADWSPQMRVWLESEAVECRVIAIDYFRETGNPEHLPLLLPQLAHPDAQVRRAAVRALNALVKPDTIAQIAPQLEACLQDPDARVRAEAAAGMLDSGDLGATLTGLATLQELLASPSAACREAIAEPLCLMRRRSRPSILPQLLRDPEAEVRRSALVACKSLRDPAMVPQIVPHLFDAETADAAYQTLAEQPMALAHYLSTVADVEQVAALLERSERLAHVLARATHPITARLLYNVLEASEDAAGTATVDAYCRVLSRLETLTPHRAEWERLVLREAYGSQHAADLLARLPEGNGNDLLRRVLRDERARRVGHVCALAAVGIKGVDAQAARRTADNDELRAYFAELADNMLNAESKSAVMRILEAGSSSRMRASVNPYQAVLEGVSNDCLAAAALYSIARSHHPAALDLAPFLRSTSAMVRETALYALARLHPEQVRNAAMDTDHDARVRALAAAIATNPQNGRLPMITVEKVLFLAQVPLFAAMRANDLAHIAAIAQEVAFEADQRIFDEGELGEQMFVIVDGEVEIHRRELVLNVLGGKDFFGEMSIIDGEPRCASATARTDCLLLRIDKSDFHELLATHGAIAISALRALNGRVRGLLPELERLTSAAASGAR